MNRSTTLVLGVLFCAPVCVPLNAEGPPKKLTAAEQKELFAKWDKLMDAGFEADQMGKYADAEPLYKDALKVARQLYNKADFPDGHNNLVLSLNNLAVLYESRGKCADAEPLSKEALVMRRSLFKDKAHPAVALSLSNLAALYLVQGKYTDAEPLYKEALEMRERLFKGKDHSDVAESLNNLGFLYSAQGKYAYAEPLYKEALAMRERLFKGKDHSDVAESLNNLAALYDSQGKYAEAEPRYKDALAMHRRLFEGAHPGTATSLNNLAALYGAQKKYADAELLLTEALQMYKSLFRGDHPDVARSLNNLAVLYRVQGKYADAESLLKESLEMRKRLFKGDHPDVALSLNNLAGLYLAQGRLSDAEPLLTEALQIYRRFITTFAQYKTEGETLTLFARQPLTRDGFVSNEWGRKADPATVYAQLWAEKGYIARVYERRQLQTRAAATDPRAARTLAELTDARRQRAELLLAPAPGHAPALTKRDNDIKTYDERIEEKTRELKKLLPALERADRLAKATPADLRKEQPAGIAVVDFLQFTHFQQNEDEPGKKGETRTARYLAFVVTREKVVWVDLDTAEKIDPAVNTWREAITGDPLKRLPPAPAEKAAGLGRKVRALVWDKVQKELPASTTAVYICPDAALCKLPFAALPGNEPGTILLEDLAVATIPHTPFLLGKLWPQDPLKSPPAEALIVGGVKYDAELSAPAPDPSAVASRGDPLVKPGQKLGWAFLANTAGEGNGVATAARARKLTVTPLRDDKATTAAVLTALPRAKYAHFATHGFFADESFRGSFRLDEKDYEKMRWGERRGHAVNSPLVMTGLVFAGANNPKTPGRGIVTGEQLIDLDLSGLELAVLSACETGLGDVAGGEGTFGLQRAFHYAGTRDVIASLWKVPDQSTAALMALFYRNLWNKNLSPMESLRQAQLELYRNPQKIPELAKGFRGKFELVPGMGGEVEVKPTKDGTAHPLLWAAFTLSGPGR